MRLQASWKVQNSNWFLKGSLSLGKEHWIHQCMKRQYGVFDLISACSYILSTMVSPDCLARAFYASLLIFQTLPRYLFPLPHCFFLSPLEWFQLTAVPCYTPCPPPFFLLKMTTHSILSSFLNYYIHISKNHKYNLNGTYLSLLICTDLL